MVQPQYFQNLAHGSPAKCHVDHVKISERAMFPPAPYAMPSNGPSCAGIRVQLGTEFLRETLGSKNQHCAKLAAR